MEKQQPNDINWGFNEEYNQPYVAFDQNLWEPVCIKQITNIQRHKGHNFIQLDKAAKMLREQVDKQIQASGKMRAENSESILLDIRQAQVTAEEHKNRLLKTADALFSQLITALKNRKLEFIQQIDDLFRQQQSTVQAHEDEWEDRQKICEDLLALSSDADADVDLVAHSTKIKQGIQKLNEGIKFQSMKLANSFEQSVKIDGMEVNHQRLVQVLSKYLVISEFKNIQYRA